MKTMITFLMLIVCSITFAQDKIYVHTATAANSSGQVTTIDHPDLNGNPNAGIVYCHNWGSSGVYNDNVTGLWYNGSQWTIFNEDTSIDIVEGSKYNVYIGDPTNVITHVSTGANQGSFGPSTTVIDNPLLNGSSPGPYAVLSNYWNSNSIYNDQNYGFYYDVALDKRGIFHETNADPIPDGAAFKILITGDGTERFDHQANAANISNNWTVLDHPTLNNNPDATFVFSHYWGSFGASSEVNLNVVLGVWYTGSNWAIYTEDLSAMPEGAAFDIIIADQEVLGIGDNEIFTPNVTMYPNPAENEVTISSEYAINNITIYNILGQEIYQTKHDTNSINIDLSNYTRGSYFVNIEMGDSIKTLKLIKN